MGVNSGHKNCYGNNAAPGLCCSKSGVAIFQMVTWNLQLATAI